MLEVFEQFCKDHEKTIAFVEAFSTLAAVLVSLLLAFSARGANKTRLKAWVDVRRITHATIPPDSHLMYLTAIITNIGIRPLRIPFSFFHWQLPLQKNASWMIIPSNAYATDDWVQQEKYPIEIAPKASHTFIISDIATFRQEFQAIIRESPRLARIFYRFVRVTILTDDGIRFTAKVGTEVRKEMRRLNPLY